MFSICEYLFWTFFCCEHALQVKLRPFRNKLFQRRSDVQKQEQKLMSQPRMAITD